MDETAWRELLGTLTVQRPLVPANDKQLDQYELQSGLRLPASYRSFCRVFGPGVLGDWYDFAVPGYTGKQTDFYELAAKNTYFRKGSSGRVCGGC